MNTNYGMSKEYQLTNRIMQGNTWACAKASAQVDSFEKEMLAEEPSFMYRHKEEVPLPLLGKVNNLFGVADGGYKTGDTWQTYLLCAKRKPMLNLQKKIADSFCFIK